MVSAVTGYADMAPTPRVDISIDDTELDGSTDSITIWQLCATSEYEVADAIEINSVGGAFVTDYMPPLGVPVTYRVEQFASGVSIGFADITLTVQVDVDQETAIFQDPYAPNSSVQIYMTDDFASRLSTSRDVRKYRAGDATIGLLGRRGLLEGVPLTCETDTLEEAASLAEVLQRTYLLVRTMPLTLLPSLFYTVVPTVTKIPIDVQFGGGSVLWDMVGDEVTRSSVGTLESPVNYQLYADAYATYADAAAAYSTYLDAKSSPPSAA